MKKTVVILINILITLILLVGSVIAIENSCKIVKTSIDLIVLRDNAIFYNENPRKTDSMTEDYLENHSYRQAIYNSEDNVVRVFSNLPTLFKMLGLILAVIAIPLIPYMWICKILKEINAYRRRKARRARRARTGVTARGAYRNGRS